ncbi:MAG TPA: PEGA domain-containing protein [Methanoregula sp.]|nr:PEGA domain-containing protein [Methanoregula sp.]
MKVDYTYLISLLVIACMIVPVLAVDGNTTNTTTVATTAITNATPVVTTTTTASQNVTTPNETAATATVIPTTIVTTIPVTTVTTVVPAATPTTGGVFVASSPPGAAILIDGVYHGTTPGTVTALAPGNHLIRLSLSGYIDYEGTIYVIAGQETTEYGTLHPMSTGSPQIIVATPSVPATTIAPVTIQPVATVPASESPLENPTVLAALIGIITASIGAGASIFTHKAKTEGVKKEEEPEQDKDRGDELDL